MDITFQLEIFLKFVRPMRLIQYVKPSIRPVKMLTFKNLPPDGGVGNRALTLHCVSKI